MSVDCLALCYDVSKKRDATEVLMGKELGVGDEVNEGSSNSKGRLLLEQIKARKMSDGLPVMQIDGSIEFKPADPVL